MNIRITTTTLLCINLISSAAFSATVNQELLLNAIKNNSEDGVQQALIEVVKQGNDDKSPEVSDEIKQAVLFILEQEKNNMSPITWEVLRQNADYPMLQRLVVFRQKQLEQQEKKMSNGNRHIQNLFLDVGHRFKKMADVILLDAKKVILAFGFIVIKSIINIIILSHQQIR